MKGLKRVDQAADAAYPTLAEFKRDRRSFLRSVVLGGLTVAVLPRCDSSLGAYAGKTGGGADGAGDGAGDITHPPSPPQPDVGPEASPPYVPPDEYDPPYAGGPRAPEYHWVRLPAEGTFRSVYLDSGGYLSFAVTFNTYDASFANLCAEEPEAALEVLAAALVKKDCEQLLSDDGQAAAEAEITAALDAAFQPTVDDEYGYYYYDEAIVGLALVLDFCEAPMAIDVGSMPDPDYP